LIEQTIGNLKTRYMDATVAILMFGSMEAFLNTSYGRHNI
jgi:hypothetical protein